uniref:RING-type E3 ubiquitin transferase n=1 Tax=Ananas comosus var. bracteatus TaxID=296719 RepID=A0A6V7PAJ9_ANACO|nr:unnamed protein product [Ananas comosus var. bracteatus]
MDAAADDVSLPYYHYECPCLTMSDPIVQYEMASCDSIVINLTFRKQVQYITRQMETSVFDRVDPPEKFMQACYHKDVTEFASEEAAKRACLDILRDVDGFSSSPHMFDGLSREIGSSVHAAAEAKKAYKDPVVVRFSARITLYNRMIHDDKVARVQLLLRAAAVPKRLSGKSCPICLHKFDEEVDFLELRCSHAFHHSCILRWLRRSTTCPTCYHDIAKDLS